MPEILPVVDAVNMLRHREGAGWGGGIRRRPGLVGEYPGPDADWTYITGGLQWMPLLLFFFCFAFHDAKSIYPLPTHNRLARPSGSQTPALRVIDPNNP